MADETLEEAIRENATGPKQATVDGQSVEQHGLADQIAADQYLKRNAVMNRPARALRRTKLVPPGAD